ncbi:KTSC domain-containing protein [Pseudomonas sp. SO81]|uniref:KTSC domain-containing protein n=1 Tax=Pseudomonas sp. SO81 TaxID=2983246 RepID=UPI0025A3E0E1|nr:KTSC domain-containing protein [Pseudomonas sp. SO81]
MIHVQSKAITAIGYDPASQRMKITFQQGHTYYFCRVPAQIYEDFMRSASKGNYYNAKIKDRYQC